MNEELNEVLNAMLNADAISCHVALLEAAFCELAREKRVQSELRKDVDSATVALETSSRVRDAVTRIRRTPKNDESLSDQQRALRLAQERLALAHENSMTTRLQRLEMMKESAEKSVEQLMKTIQRRLPTSLKETLLDNENVIASPEVVGTVVDDAVILFSSRVCELCELLSNCTSSTDESQLHVAQRYAAALKHSKDVDFALSLARIDQAALHQHFVNARNHSKQVVERQPEPSCVVAPSVEPCSTALLPPAKHVLSYRFGFRSKNDLDEYCAQRAKLTAVRLSSRPSAFLPIESIHDASLAACFINDHSFCPPFVLNTEESR